MDQITLDATFASVTGFYQPLEQARGLACRWAPVCLSRDSVAEHRLARYARTQTTIWDSPRLAQ